MAQALMTVAALIGFALVQAWRWDFTIPEAMGVTAFGAVLVFIVLVSIEPHKKG